MAPRRRVLLVDDHPVVRRGLHALLEGEPWVEDVIDASTAVEAVREAVIRRVDVVAMDLTLPDGDGVDVTRRIVDALPSVKVLIVTMSNEPDLVTRCLRAGASGYLLKETDPDVIVQALRMVIDGCIVLGPRVGRDLLSNIRQAPADLPPPLDRLTARERAVLVRLASGDTNAQIARHLNLSEKTVRNHLSVMFTKLGVADRFQAAMLARDNGVGPRP